MTIHDSIKTWATEARDRGMKKKNMSKPGFGLFCAVVYNNNKEQTAFSLLQVRLGHCCKLGLEIATMLSRSVRASSLLLRKPLARFMGNLVVLGDDDAWEKLKDSDTKKV